MKIFFSCCGGLKFVVLLVGSLLSPWYMTALGAGLFGLIILLSHRNGMVEGLNPSRRHDLGGRRHVVPVSPSPMMVPTDPCEQICSKEIVNCGAGRSSSTCNREGICTHLYWDDETIIYSRLRETGLAPLLCHQAATITTSGTRKTRRQDSDDTTPSRAHRRRRTSRSGESSLFSEPLKLNFLLTDKYKKYFTPAYERLLTSGENSPMIYEEEEMFISVVYSIDDLLDYSQPLHGIFRCIFQQLRTILIDAMVDYPFPPAVSGGTNFLKIVNIATEKLRDALKDLSLVLTSDDATAEARMTLSEHFKSPLTTITKWRKSLEILIGSSFNQAGDVEFARNQFSMFRDFVNILNLSSQVKSNNLVSAARLSTVDSMFEALSQTRNSAVLAELSDDEVAFHIDIMRRRIYGKAMKKGLRIRFPHRVLNIFRKFQAIVGSEEGRLALPASVDMIRDFCGSHGRQLVDFLKKLSAKDEFNSVTVSIDMIVIASVCGERLSLETRGEVIPAFLHGSFKLIDPLPLAQQDEEDEDSDDDGEEGQQGDDEDETEWWHIRVDEKETDLFESMDLLSGFSKSNLLGNEFKVKFIGSPSIGRGPTISWLSRNMVEIFNPENGFFVASDERNLFLKPPSANEPSDLVPLSPHKIDHYRQIGRMLGMAIKYGVSPGIHLTRGCLEYIRSPFQPQESLANSVSIVEWLREENTGIVVGMDAMKAMNWSDPSVASAMSFLTFDGYIDNGESLVVSADNLEQYMWLKAEFVVLKSIQEPMIALVRGIYDVIPYNQLSMFTANELNDMLSGGADSSEIDIDDLRAATRVIPASQTSSEFMTWFWSIVESFSQQDRVKLIEFVSGMSRPPMHGFTGIDGTKKWLTIAIQSGLSRSSLPLSQLCFVELRLPRYSSKNKLRRKLLKAIRESDTLQRT